MAGLAHAASAVHRDAGEHLSSGKAAPASASTTFLTLGSQVKIQPVAKYDWEQKYYYGNLIAVSNSFLAYAIRGELGQGRGGRCSAGSSRDADSVLGHSAHSDVRDTMEVFPLPGLGEPSGKTKLEIGGNTEAGKGMASLLLPGPRHSLTANHCPDSSCQQWLSDGAGDQCQHIGADAAQGLHRQCGRPGLRTRQLPTVGLPR